jgi:hypothetical protein
MGDIRASVEVRADSQIIQTGAAGARAAARQLLRRNTASKPGGQTGGFRCGENRRARGCPA